MKAYLMEFIGTLFLVLAIGLTGNPLAIGLMLMAMVYMGGHISGAHYNPAVTLAVYLRGKLKSDKIAGYMLSQLLGAVVASLVLMYLAKPFVPAMGSGAGLGQAYLIEILLTFVLASVILAVATSKKLDGNYIYGLAIGLTLAAIAFAGGPISGGAFNPAVGLGPLIVAAFSGTINAQLVLLYLVGPLVGGALAGVVFKKLN